MGNKYKNKSIFFMFFSAQMPLLLSKSCVFSKEANKNFDNFFDNSEFCICHKPHRTLINKAIFDFFTSHGYLYDTDMEAYFKTTNENE